MDRVTVFLDEINKAYSLAHKQLPPLQDRRMEATALNDDLRVIPDAWIKQAYKEARLRFNPIPIAKDVFKAWNDHLKADYEESLKRSSLTYSARKTHVCAFCAVVARRLLDKKAMEGVEICSEERDCFEAQISTTPWLREYWMQNINSPYNEVTK